MLVIEDEELLGKNIRLYLERQGHDVRLASSAEAGLEMIEEFKPEAIVLDFNPVSSTHLRAHETVLDLVCRLLLANKQHH